MRCVRFVAVALAAATPVPFGWAFAQEPAAAPKPSAGYTLTVTGGVTAEFAPTVGRLTTLFYECYPKLVQRFEHPQKPAPRSIKLVFEPRMRVPAYCSNAEIHISVEWLTKHPDDIALLTHELTHAVQAYPRGEPGWITEGIADYARLKYGPKEQPDWSLPKRLTSRNSYRESYRVSARFFVWLDEKHPGSVDKIHRLMQDRTYDPDAFKTATGKSLDELWEACVKDLGDGEKASKEKAPQKK